MAENPWMKELNLSSLLFILGRLDSSMTSYLNYMYDRVMHLRRALADILLGII